jgi:glycosyltransferase involved in cell wall biosynthesis
MLKSNKKLTLAFAAIGERLDKLKGCLSIVDLIKQVQVVVVVQRWTDDHKKIIEEFPQIDFVWQQGQGLSRSRNEALAHAQGEYTWLLDDDVELQADDIAYILLYLDAHSEIDFFRVKIGCIEWRDKFFKNYKKIDKVKRLNLLQVSSIELIGRTQFIKQRQLQFNENIGLGTPYQGSEEIHFLLDAWDKDAKFEFIDKVLIRHTCIFDERVLADNNIFKIRGATASRFGLLGILLLGRWGIRSLFKEKNPIYIYHLFRGFCRGYSSFK